MAKIKPILLDSIIQKKVDDTGDIIYVWYADKGILASEEKWHIMKITTVLTETSIQYASEWFDKVWNDRNWYTYN